MSVVSMFDPGVLNHRLKLQRIVETPDGCGGVINSWIDEAELWAKIDPVGVNSDYLALQQNETAKHRVTVRFRTPLPSGWRFVLSDRVFHIQTVQDPDERRAFLICLTHEEGR